MNSTNYSEFSSSCIHFADALMAEFKVDKFNYLPDSARRAFYDIVVKMQNEEAYFRKLKENPNPCGEVPLPIRYGGIEPISFDDAVPIPYNRPITLDSMSEVMDEMVEIEEPRFENGDTLKDDLVFEVHKRNKIEVDKNGLDKNGRFVW